MRASSAGATKLRWKNKASPGIWQQIVEKLESKAAVTEFVCDVVWIIRGCASSCSTSVFVSQSQTHRVGWVGGAEREREGKRVFRRDIHHKNIALSPPRYLHHIHSTQMWINAILSSYPPLCVGGAIISILLRPVRSCRCWSGEVKRPLSGYSEERSAEETLGGVMSLSARPVPKTHPGSEELKQSSTQTASPLKMDVSSASPTHSQHSHNQL